MCRMRLGDLRPGTTGTIDKLECRRQLKRRLMDMGVVCGTSFSVELNGFNLSLRKEEAGDIWVEVPCE
jgi:Fe2+ transport system protein FeoA